MTLENNDPENNRAIPRILVRFNSPDGYNPDDDPEFVPEYPPRESCDVDIRQYEPYIPTNVIIEECDHEPAAKEVDDIDDTDIIIKERDWRLQDEIKELAEFFEERGYEVEGDGFSYLSIQCPNKCLRKHFQSEVSSLLHFWNDSKKYNISILKTGEDFPRCEEDSGLAILMAAIAGYGGPFPSDDDPSPLDDDPSPS